MGKMPMPLALVALGGRLPSHFFKLSSHVRTSAAGIQGRHGGRPSRRNGLDFPVKRGARACGLQRAGSDASIRSSFMIKPLLLITLGLGLASPLHSATPGTVRFVDGVEIDAEILFVHPHAKVLIVRSPSHAIAQSLPLAEIASVTQDGKTTSYSAPRSLTEEEKITREKNSLGGNDVGAGQLGHYAKETWDKAPLIVWAKPGESGDAMVAASWLDESGQPLQESPWKSSDAPKDKKKPELATLAFGGDVLLPAADTPYKAIQSGNRDRLEAAAIRHLTVENNAAYNVRYTILGNLWMKRGSSIGDKTQTGGLGGDSLDKNRFARFSNNDSKLEPAWAYAEEISHWVYIDGGDNGSLEIIGTSGGAGDRLTHRRGTLIMSEDSYIGNGPRGSFFSQEGTTTILLDGARLGCASPLVADSRATYGIGGTLMFGTPERPLKKDLRFEGVYFDEAKINPDAVPNQRTSGASFVLGMTGQMKVHSSDPAKARVIFCPRSKNLPVLQYSVPKEAMQFCKRGPDKGILPPDPELWTAPGIPQTIAAVFRGATKFDGVMFEGFGKGTIIVNGSERKAWKNVFFGENAAEPDELFRNP